jgi:hypothetical protein
MSGDGRGLLTGSQLAEVLDEQVIDDLDPRIGGGELVRQQPFAS